MSKPASKPAEDALVEGAFDKSKHEQVAAAIQKLTSEEAAFFLAKLERALKKRKIQIVGYLVAMVVWVIAMLGALAYFGLHDGFVGWVFLVPFGFVGLVIYLFGRAAERAAVLPEVSPPPSES